MSFSAETQRADEVKEAAVPNVCRADTADAITLVAHEGASGK